MLQKSLLWKTLNFNYELVELNINLIQRERSNYSYLVSDDCGRRNFTVP